MRLAVIPARAGSKRIPHKNTRNFGGEPMIAHTIRAALNACTIDRVWVSTDDEMTAAIARAHGAETPFLRPAHLAGDHTIMKDVMRHAIGEATRHAERPSAVCMLFATAPLMRSADIDSGYRALVQEQADYALSVMPFAFAPQRAQVITEDGRLAYLHPEFSTTRSQDLPDCYHDAAQFVWATTEAFDSDCPTTALRTVPVVVPSRTVVDIDTPDDWDLAEQRFYAERRHHDDTSRAA